LHLSLNRQEGTITISTGGKKHVVNETPEALE
jgi:hypothetical protein